MAAKKSASRKRKKASASRRKVTARKASTAKKKASKKAAKKTSRKAAKKTAKKASKKKPAAKRSAGKKAASKKKSRKVTKKKATTKKATPKKAGKKKAGAKKTAKKVSRKKAVAKKKPAPRKAPAKKKTAARKPARRARKDVLTAPIHGVEPYRARRGEEYMSDAQLEHFREILTAWKRELMFEVDRTVHHMQDEAANFPDPNDRATQESEFGLELRTRDRERKLLRKIESALARIDDGSYGYCDETGEEIGLKRLEARPVATLCLEAQERRELAERQFRDRDDRYR